MFGLPWWLWLVGLIVAVVFVVFVGFRAAQAARARMRREFVEYLRRQVSDVVVVAERERELDIRAEGGVESRLRLDRLFKGVTKLSRDDIVGREVLFARFAQMIRDHDRALRFDTKGATKLFRDDVVGREVLFARFARVIRDHDRALRLDPAGARGRVFARLANDALLNQLRGELVGLELPAVSSGVAGLWGVFVLDRETSVIYLTARHLDELSLTPEEALALSKENLASTFDRGMLQGALAGESVITIQYLDSFDAARLLLLPGCLGEDEQLAALIPDRDTLVVTAVPADGDWASLRKLARTPAGDVLWGEPLLVTRDGISEVRS